MDTLLVVGEEGQARRDLVRDLRAAGFDVLEASSATEALKVAGRVRTDVIVLHDLTPRSLLDACHELRRCSPLPILALTPVDSELDVAVALEVGADDYVTTPVDPRALAARLQAVLRRARADEVRRANGRLLRVGDVLLSLESRTAEVGGRAVQLAPKEFTLLHLLMRNAGRVLSRLWLRDQLWCSGSEEKDDAALSSEVKRLRARLEGTGAARSRITTIRGVGYRYDGGADA